VPEQHIPYLIALDDDVMAVMSILIYARLFKYCAESKSIEHLYTVLYKSLAEIIPFFSKTLKYIFGFSLILPDPPTVHAHADSC